MFDVIYIDRLRGGKTLEIDQTLDGSCLGVDEVQLKFEKQLHLKGSAYLSGDHLVIRFDVETEARMPCSICNEMTSVPISVKKGYHTVPIEEIKGRDFKPDEVIRDAILLEVPMLAECQGRCPERETLKPFLEKEEHDTCFPFSELKLDEEN